jgi:hypothetical protein
MVPGLQQLVQAATHCLTAVTVIVAHHSQGLEHTCQHLKNTEARKSVMSYACTLLRQSQWRILARIWSTHAVLEEQKPRGEVNKRL